MTARYLVLVLALVLASSLHADRVELANGDVITGTILSMSATKVVVSTEYGTIEIDRSRVVRGVFESTAGVGTVPRVNDGTAAAPAASTATAAALAEAAGLTLAPTAPTPATAATPAASPAATSRSDAPAAVAGAADARIERGLVFHFPLDGDLTDRAGAHVLVNNGMRSLPGDAPEGALHSDGSGTHLSISPGPAINDLEAFTLSFQVRPDDVATTTYLVSKWTRADADRADGKFALQLSRGGLSLFLVDASGRYSWIGAAGALTANTWQRVTFSYGDGIASLYVDANRVAARSLGFTGLLSESAPLLFMTAEAAMSEPFVHYNARGAIRDLRLYDRVLSQSEVDLLAAFTGG